MHRKKKSGPFWRRFRITVKGYSFGPGRHGGAWL